MSCRTCLHFLPSAEAGQRAWLEGFGYCKAAPTPLERAQFFRESRDCWLVPDHYQERRA